MGSYTVPIKILFSCREVHTFQQRPTLSHTFKRLPSANLERRGSLSSVAGHLFETRKVSYECVLFSAALMKLSDVLLFLKISRDLCYHLVWEPSWKEPQESIPNKEKRLTEHEACEHRTSSLFRQLVMLPFQSIDIG